ncbi:MAG: S-methyl-5-thioribose-1-phosphate isomerase [bacterium]
MTVSVIAYRSGRLTVLDQTRLPGEALAVELDSLEAVEVAIRTLQVRGAPLIGITAAYGVCVAFREALGQSNTQDGGHAARICREAIERLSRTRPTAVNLFWALERMTRVVQHHGGGTPDGLHVLLPALEAEAAAIHEETRAQDAAMAGHGSALIPAGAKVITHCNTGPLATGCGGTALGVLIEAHRRHGNHGGIHVLVDETRPRWQGAHLTTWELKTLGVPHTLICDNAAAMMMRLETIHSVWVGADRIAANGDTANKIGTYSLAVNARHHGVSFYVTAPSSTVDLTLDDGAGIPIEHRDPAEVSAPGGRAIAPPGTPASNPAFDVTPAELITGIVTERGVHRGPVYDLRGDLGI